MPFDASGNYTPVSGAETASSGQVVQSAVWNNINTDYQTALTALGKGNVTRAQNPAGSLTSRYLTAVQTVNFAASASDIGTFAITLPVSISNYQVNNMRIYNAAANLNSATVSLFTAAGGGGTSVIGSTTTTITTNAANTANAVQIVQPSVSTLMLNSPSLFLHVTSSTATSSTANVVLEIFPLY